MQTASSDTPSALSSAATVSGHTGYYTHSEAAQFRSSLEAAVGRFVAAEAAATAALAALTETVDREVVKGRLAAQQSETAAEEATYAALRGALTDQQCASAELVAATAALEKQRADLAVEETECAGRMAVLEERKRRQMENVENTRLEVAAARVETARAQRELRRRKAVVRDLQQEIERRKARLRKHRRNNK